MFCVIAKQIRKAISLHYFQLSIKQTLLSGTNSGV